MENILTCNQHIIWTKNAVFMMVNMGVWIYKIYVYHISSSSEVLDFLATMDCKHEDTNYMERFSHIFNGAYKETSLTKEKFNLTDWCSNMAGTNFNGRKQIYGEDVVKRLKDNMLWVLL